MYSIGLDISKSTIAVHIPLTRLDLEIDNTSKGIKGLYAKLKKLYKKAFPELVFVYEPMGSYSALLTKFCNQKKIQVFMINPKQSKNYAKALGQRSKTDKIDARILSKAIAVAEEDEIRVPYLNSVVEEMKELMSYYKFTVKQRVKVNNHLEALESKKGNRYAINDLKKSMKAYKLQEKRFSRKSKRLSLRMKNFKKVWIISKPLSESVISPLSYCCTSLSNTLTPISAKSFH